MACRYPSSSCSARASCREGGAREQLQKCREGKRRYPSSSCPARDSCQQQGEDRRRLRDGRARRDSAQAAKTIDCRLGRQDSVGIASSPLPCSSHRPPSRTGLVFITIPTSEASPPHTSQLHPKQSPPPQPYLERHPLPALLHKPRAAQHAVPAGGPVAGPQLPAAQVHLKGARPHQHPGLVLCTGWINPRSSGA